MPEVNAIGSADATGQVGEFPEAGPQPETTAVRGDSEIPDIVRRVREGRRPEVVRLTLDEMKALTLSPIAESLSIQEPDAKRAELEALAVKDGVVASMVVTVPSGDGLAVIDGVFGHEMCVKHGLPAQFLVLPLLNDDDIREEILRRSLARPDLNLRRLRYLRGHLFELRVRRQGQRTDLTPGTSDQTDTKSETAVAAGLGTSLSTLRRDAKAAAALDRIADATRVELREGYLAGKIRLSYAEIDEMSKLRPPRQGQAAARAVREGWWKERRRNAGDAAKALGRAWAKADLTERMAFLRELIERGERENFLAVLDLPTTTAEARVA